MKVKCHVNCKLMCKSMHYMIVSDSMFELLTSIDGSETGSYSFRQRYIYSVSCFLSW